MKTRTDQKHVNLLDSRKTELVADRDPMCKGASQHLQSTSSEFNRLLKWSINGVTSVLATTVQGSRMGHMN